ncbi:solute carrier family 2, facilitated glucose transporter member 3-like isoform X1 [Anopheles albimanus]|uniref:solute carrier family 2, facilitated glucose transporter member 3-like isoform X1 n=1 Tax=Anopheles albimanus TaxID=7167 RepID=UPI00163FDE31|nr:solute carrier family 2, facilitated glucose transporter member 3-like isoform X1 [Anopheles albimanus]
MVMMELKLPDTGLTWGLCCFGLIVNVSVSVAAGYQVSSINAPAEIIKAWIRAVVADRYGVNLSVNSLTILWSSVVSVVLLGGIITSHFSSYISTKYGRKRSFLFCAILLTAGACCFQFCRAASSVELLLLGRLLVGLASGLTTSVIPMYLAESSPIKLRGAMGVLCPFGLTAGVVVGQLASLEQVLGTEANWHYALSCFAVLNVICYAFYFWIPESPKYLYSVKGDQVGSLRAIRKLFGRHSIGDDYIKLQMECATGNSNGVNRTRELEPQISPSLWSVLRDPTLRLPLILVCALQGGQQLSGINAVFFYSVSIFESVGFSSTAAKFANLGVGCLNLLVSFFGPILMARCNRRLLCLLSCSACSVILFVLTMSIYLIDIVSWFSFVCIGTIFLYIIFFQLGLGPIPFFIGSGKDTNRVCCLRRQLLLCVVPELFELGPRPTAMALGSLSSWGCNFIVGMAFPTLQGIWGAFVFLPFSITCVLLTFLIKFYLPETRGKEISDVVKKVSYGFHSRVLRDE